MSDASTTTEQYASARDLVAVLTAMVKNDRAGADWLLAHTDPVNLLLTSLDFTAEVLVKICPEPLAYLRAQAIALDEHEAEQQS